MADGQVHLNIETDDENKLWRHINNGSEKQLMSKKMEPLGLNMTMILGSEDPKVQQT